MRSMSLAVASVLAAWTIAGWTQPAPSPAVPTHIAAQPVLSLAQALALAETGNPTLRSRQAQLAAAEGTRTEAAALLFNNPQLAVDRTRRTVPLAGLPTERRNEWSAGVSQTFEVAGQRGMRRHSAEAGLTATREEIETTRRQVRAETAQQFYRVLALQQRVALEEQALRLFEGTASAVQKRRNAGEDTKLDANVALVEAERARNQLASAREQLIDARAELANLLQSTADQLPVVAGDLEYRIAAEPSSADDLLATAMAQPRLRALAARVDSAQARLSLERASRNPDVTVGVNVGREGANDARERLTTISVSLPLPLFKRNESAIGQAVTGLSQAEIEQRSTTRDLEAQVRALRSRLMSLQQRAQRLKQSMLPTLADNEQLSLKSQRAGQIGLLELIVVNRQTLDARRDLVDALNDYQTTRIALDLAAGRPTTDDQGAQP